MATFLNTQNSKRTAAGFGKVKIHVTSFMMGGTEPASERTLARTFLETIAKTTSGSYRAMDDSPKT